MKRRELLQSTAALSLLPFGGIGEVFVCTPIRNPLELTIFSICYGGVRGAEESWKCQINVNGLLITVPHNGNEPVIEFNTNGHMMVFHADRLERHYRREMFKKGVLV